MLDASVFLKSTYPFTRILVEDKGVILAVSYWKGDVHVEVHNEQMHSPCSVDDVLKRDLAKVQSFLDARFVLISHDGDLFLSKMLGKIYCKIGLRQVLTYKFPLIEVHTAAFIPCIATLGLEQVSSLTKEKADEIVVRGVGL